jgi:NAD(P)-dependent dehydrogenase (short-subunit alcohol dehydrogenase family)
VGTTSRMVRITHPFHPLTGHEIELICRRLHWGDDRIAYHNEAGRLSWISADLTDVDPPDDFQRVAAGTAAFRPVDLLVLCALLDRLRECLEHDES